MSVNHEVQVPPPAARRSLNEIEAMGKRAARGVGLCWGLAEEAGKAVRWLMARGYPGASSLARILTCIDGRDHADLSPVMVDGVWRASAGRLCPLITGPALCDRATEIAAGRVIELGDIAQPLLLIPFVAGAVKLTGATLAIGWDDVTMTITREGEVIDGNRASLTARSAGSVRCRRVDDVEHRAMPAKASAVPIDAATWSRLGVFAQRTFAPATEASRLLGAGAGLGGED